MRQFIGLSISVLLVLCSGCSDSGTVAPFQLDPGVVGKVSLTFSNPPQEIVAVVATITRRDFPMRVLELAVSDSMPVATGSFANVEPGVWHLRVVALDSARSIRYSGETDVDVQPGQTAQVALQLEPAIGGGIEIVVTWGSGGPNLLVNGSFEQGPLVGTYLPLDSGSTAINGWVVSRWQIDLVTFWRAHQGIKSVDLNGNPSLGGIRQSFPTIAGRTYMVRFALAGNPEGPQGVKTVGVRAAGVSTQFTFNTTGKTITNMGWMLKSWGFVAVGSETTLEFYSLDPMPSFFGPAIDNVSVEAVQ